MRNRFYELRAKTKDAKVKLTLRILVALYLLYLTKEIVGSAVQTTSPLPLWVTVLVGSVFALASAAFGIYAWRQYKDSPAGTADKWKPKPSGENGERSSDYPDRK